MLFTMSAATARQSTPNETSANCFGMVVCGWIAGIIPRRRSLHPICISTSSARTCFSRPPKYRASSERLRPAKAAVDPVARRRVACMPRDVILGDERATLQQLHLLNRHGQFRREVDALYDGHPPRRRVGRTHQPLSRSSPIPSPIRARLPRLYLSIGHLSLGIVHCMTTTPINTRS